MPFTERESLAAVAVGILADALVIALGLTVPLGDPSRDRVDNSLLLLGGCGVLIAWLTPRAHAIRRSSSARTMLALYGALSLTAVALADFGAMRRTGWAIKLAVAALFALAVGRLARRG